MTGRLTTILSPADRRGASMMCRLLVRVGEREQRRLAPGAAEELESRRQRVPPRISHRDGNGGKACARREQLIVVATRRVEVSDQSGRVAPRRVNQRIQMLVVHHLQDTRAEL